MDTLDLHPNNDEPSSQELLKSDIPKPVPQGCQPQI